MNKTNQISMPFLKLIKHNLSINDVHQFNKKDMFIYF